MTLLDRLADKFTVGDGCWEWTAGHDSYGYGSIWCDTQKRKRQAHIVMYELMVGPVPEGKELDHLCRNPKCVRPDHLDPKTHRDNLLVGIGITAVNAKKTHCNWGHEFTPENTVRYPSGHGSRECRACVKRRNDARTA